MIYTCDICWPAEQQGLSEAMACLAWLGFKNLKPEARARSSPRDGLAWLDETMACPLATGGRRCGKGAAHGDTTSTRAGDGRNRDGGGGRGSHLARGGTRRGSARARSGAREEHEAGALPPGGKEEEEEEDVLLPGVPLSLVPIRNKQSFYGFVVVEAYAPMTKTPHNKTWQTGESQLSISWNLSGSSGEAAAGMDADAECRANFDIHAFLRNFELLGERLRLEEEMAMTAESRDSLSRGQ
ncbi:hypothetical protein C8R47DRAFT_1197278 [Mycena vitilis]|nr:hypothetical protein C8R47DRAFT_1197278 [Mycena vitilis]